MATHNVHYVFPGCTGDGETKAGKLHFTLAQLEYVHTINLLHCKGAHYKNHLYVCVPEIHHIVSARG